MTTETIGIVKQFERWVMENYKPRIIDDPDPKWDRRKELYYKIGEFHYGPIPIDDIPKEFNIK